MCCQVDDVGVPCVSNTTVVAHGREAHHLSFSYIISIQKDIFFWIVKYGTINLQFVKQPFHWLLELRPQ